MEQEAAAWDAREAYRFLTAAVAPRPIAWVTTLSPAGLPNAAPFSWFNAVCADPMMLAISIQRRADGSLKDTVRNIRDTGEFVVNAVTRGLVAPMVASSVDFPPDVSEPERLGLRLAPSKAVRPPRLADSPIHFECRLHSETVLGRKGDLSHVLGEVVHVGADDAVLDAHGHLDPAKAVLLARMGGANYVAADRPFEHKRPSGDALRGA
ncbi:MAG: hypothetical protein QOD77_668 [Thermoplasmata archaeon]|nr:hypothetical protein [Thermoplasmata archaeon]